MAAPFKYTAKEFEAKFELYKQWLDTQFIERVEYNQKLNEQFNVKLKKPPTVQSLCLFLNIHPQTFYNIINIDSINIDIELIDIATRAKHWIMDYQLSGAAVGTLNATIISRINNLSDTVQVNSNVTLNALPVNVSNNVIDLTDMDFAVIDNE